MNYSNLIEAMHQFRTNQITRTEMVAAIALWQRPVECAREAVSEALEAVIR